MHPMKFLRWILSALAFTYLAAVAPAQISITVTTAPPALPVYEQPPCPEEGWMWSPGYWAWDDDGYYWVPGEWVPAPYTGAMWTPPWWGWQSGRYLFHEGYWGNEVGYYGGIDYGYGYMGEGFSGGEWRDGRFAYNTAVMRVNPTVIRNTYVNETIVRERTIVNERHIAYNGGPDGIRHEPSPIERRAMTERHTSLTPVQQQQIQAARSDRSSYARANGGRPQRVVVARPEVGGRAGGTSLAPGPARGETRTEPSRPSREYRNEPSRNQPERNQPNSRPESRPAPSDRPYREQRPTPIPRTESRPLPDPRNESRPEPPAERPRTESRPAPPFERPRTESRPAPDQRQTRPEPLQRPAPQREYHPAPSQRPEPQHESRPAPQPHAREESRPVPQHESPGGQMHAEQRPAPQREARPANPHEEKSRPQ